MKNLKSILSYISEGLHDMCYIWWLETKNTIKDEGVLIFFILVPLAYPLLYSWIYNNEVVRDVPVAIVDMWPIIATTSTRHANSWVDKRFMV